MENPAQLTPRFTQAVDYAGQDHGSLRKGHRCRMKFDMRCVGGRKEVQTEYDEESRRRSRLACAIRNLLYALPKFYFVSLSN
jgi:hypothetical protein